MSVKKSLFLFIAFTIGLATSSSYAEDIISCSGFESCPDTDTSALEARIAALEALLANVTRGTDPNTSQDTLTFTNMNVQVVSGSGTTTGTPTGTGNLIIGYNELREEDNVRSGSHMLVIGELNNYSSFAGMVVGQYNTASGGFSSVSGGLRNVASAWFASVSGGADNTASSNGASVSGGGANIASSESASVSGGVSKTADSVWCTTAGEIGTDCVP